MLLREPGRPQLPNRLRLALIQQGHTYPFELTTGELREARSPLGRERLARRLGAALGPPAAGPAHRPAPGLRATSPDPLREERGDGVCSPLRAGEGRGVRSALLAQRPDPRARRPERHRADPARDQPERQARAVQVDQDAPGTVPNDIAANESSR